MWTIGFLSLSRLTADGDELFSRESLRSRHRIILLILISVPGLRRGKDRGTGGSSHLLPSFPHLPKLAASPWLPVWGLEGGECGCGGRLEKLSLALPVARPASHPLSGAHTRPPRHTPRAPSRSCSPAAACSLSSALPGLLLLFFFFFWYHRVALKTEDRGSLRARHLQRSLHWEKTWSQLRQPPTPPPASRAVAARTRPQAPGRPR